MWLLNGVLNNGVRREEVDLNDVTAIIDGVGNVRAGVRRQREKLSCIPWKGCSDRRGSRRCRCRRPGRWSRCGQVSAETGVVPQQKDAHGVYLARHNVMRIGQKKSRSTMTTGSFGYGRERAGQQVVRRDVAILRACDV